MDDLGLKLKNLRENVEKVIVGKKETIELILIALICEGHVLIEDVPGVGKTSLAAALAKSVQGDFKRIQFTPDILPSDITGFSMYNQKSGEFEYKPGAILSQFVLADEINRTSPKAQASLLQVMEEGKLTVDGITYEMPKPFMILATQNPVEYLGTFPLPEAQMDRFFMKVGIGYPSNESEKAMLSRFKVNNPLDTLEAVVSGTEILKMQQAVRMAHVEESIEELIINIVGQTRIHPDVVLGASPRGSINLYRAAQGLAFYNARNYVIPDDVIKMAVPILSHRLQLQQEAKLKKITGEAIVTSILSKIRMPKVR